MATTMTATTQTRGAASRGRRGRGRGGNRGPRAPVNGNAKAEVVPGNERPVEAEGTKTTGDTAEAADEADDGTVCWICAEQVKYWSVSECNHRTCHVCALRLRALYKKLECTFCKEPQASVIFTKSPDALWSSYTPDMIPYKDAKLNISFETEEMMEESLILLRFNCPDSSCDYIGTGWSDLKLHVRAVHGKLMCDLCLRHKKVFAHEHALYTPSELPIHVPSIYRSPGSRKDKPKEQIEGGVHPYCEFCRECFFSDDELYSHMRERHEECFVCKRDEVKDQYFRNYDALEQHFMHAHYPCTHPECLARKFVVFGSALDLKAHMVEEHGAEMSARDRRDAMRVQAEFEYDDAAGHGGRTRRNRGGGGEREREPPPHLPPGAAQAQSAAVRPNTGAQRRAAFGGNLTANPGSGSATPSAAAGRQASRPPSPPRPDEPMTPEKNPALAARIAGLAPNAGAAVAAVQAAIRSYRVSESAARDLILTVWNILDHNMDGTASIINYLVDLFEEDDKKRDLLTAWNGFKIEQRAQFPELVPAGLGTEWAGVTSGRVLNAKSSTSARSSRNAARQGQVWDRVARAAASSPAAGSSTTPAPRPPDRFPTLQPAAATSTRQPPRTTPWAASSAASPPAPRGPVSVPGPGARGRPAPAPALSKSAFPELPSTAPTRVPKGAVGGNQSLKRILGDTQPTLPAWNAAKGGSNDTNGATFSSAQSPTEEQSEEAAGGGKKKGKGKQKQTLFTLGSFPTG